MFDLAIAGGLVIAAIVVFLLNRAGVLPTKALPFVAAAVFGAVGWSIFREKRREQALKDLDRKREELKEHDKVLDEKRKELDISERDFQVLKSQKEAEIKSSQKAVLILETEAEKDRKKRDEELKRINELQGGELDAEFDRVMREMKAGGRS
jgi:uncharacterized membrane protein